MNNKGVLTTTGQRWLVKPPPIANAAGPFLRCRLSRFAAFTDFVGGHTGRRNLNIYKCAGGLCPTYKIVARGFDWQMTVVSAVQCSSCGIEDDTDDPPAIQARSLLPP